MPRTAQGAPKPAADAGFAYIARETHEGARYPVGTVVCAVACDSPQNVVAENLAKWAREGLTIERVPIEWVRKHLFTAEPYAAEARS